MGNIIDLSKIDYCTKERMEECDRVFGDGYVYISKNINDVVALKRKSGRWTFGNIEDGTIFGDDFKSVDSFSENGAHYQTLKGYEKDAKISDIKYALYMEKRISKPFEERTR